ncbi:MAG TPA: response regulator [Steroidobacter sp.]|nr:response regulator [Steroidobacter sp.]
MRVLIVEDDPLIADAVRQALSRAGFAADNVASAEAGRAALQAEAFDLAIVDIGLPREDGLHLIRRWRASGETTPVLILTARDGLSDRVNALDLGADDYMTKPFEVAELIARCRALIRRANAVANNQLSLGGLHLDMTHHSLNIDGQPVELTQREWSILECLVLNAGRIVTKEKLMSSVTDWTEELTPNAIEVYVSRLRGKLGEAARIRAVRGMGYRIDEKAR